MENRPEERNELIERAQHALEHPYEVEPHGDLHRYSLFLRLWRYPSFASWISWAIFEPGKYADDASALHVRQIRWDQGRDLGRFANPMEWLRQGYRAPPTIHVADTAVSRETLRPYLDELAHTRIPLLLRESSIVLDGEERGVETYSGVISTRINWLAGAERHAPDVVRSLDRLIDLLQSICQDSRPDE
jgi:hypothetical protein